VWINFLWRVNFFLLNSELSDIVVKQLALVIESKWLVHLSGICHNPCNIAWKQDLGVKKKKVAQMAHNKGHKMSPDIITRKEVQICIETKVMNKRL